MYITVTSSKWQGQSLDPGPLMVLVILQFHHIALLLKICSPASTSATSCQDKQTEVTPHKFTMPSLKCLQMEPPPTYVKLRDKVADSVFFT